MKNCRTGPRRATVEQAAKRRYPHMASGMGKAVLLFNGEPHRQWSVLVAHERTPNPVNFAAVGHEAIQLLKSPEIGLPLDNLGRFGPKHARALAAYWLTYGIRGKALELRMTVLRYWARWVGYLCRRYEELAGALPPVEGGVPVDPETHRVASETVIREAGHHDPGKIQAYNGNYNEAVRAANRAVKSLYARMTDPRVISELRELGLTGLLLVGDAADGVIKAEAITVCAYETETSDEALEFVTENLETLRTLLQVLIGTRVELARRTPAHLAAKHTLEITIPKE